jgi:hypothetical protein
MNSPRSQIRCRLDGVARLKQSTNLFQWKSISSMDITGPANTDSFLDWLPLYMQSSIRQTCAPSPPPHWEVGDPFRRMDPTVWKIPRGDQLPGWTSNEITEWNWNHISKTLNQWTHQVGSFDVKIEKVERINLVSNPCKLLTEASNL